jgi:multicomponent Na+:H+ antiporter subunit G
MLLIIGCIFIGFSIVGILRYRNIYTKILLISKVDTVATLTIIIGLIIKMGFSMATVKLIILTVFLMITNPINTHMIARAAWLNGASFEDQEGESL